MPSRSDDARPPTPDEISAVLSRVCASRPFAQAPKLTRFLRFVVETTLSGHGDRLKGYTIGVEALGRDASFDPQSDPIVRVEAIRLRAALDRYYAGDGIDDPVVIEIPRGRYVPRFRWRGSRRSWLGPALVRAIRAIQRVLQARLVLQAPSDQH